MSDPRSYRKLISVPLSVAALAVSASSLFAQRGVRSSIGAAEWTAKSASRCTVAMRALRLQPLSARSARGSMWRQRFRSATVA